MDPDACFGPKTYCVFPFGGLWLRDPSRLQDDALWRRFLRRRGVSAADRERLEAEFPMSEQGEAFDELLGQLKDPPAWLRTVLERDWILDVLAIRVEHKPGGRTVLRAPDPPPGMEPYREPYRVEIQWVFDAAAGRQISEIRLLPERSHLEARTRLNLTPYILAFLLTPGAEPAERLPRRRPAPGQPLDVDFYRRVLSQYRALLETGHPAPAAELARRMGENRSTVKSWLRRGRIYLAERGGKEEAREVTCASAPRCVAGRRIHPARGARRNHLGRSGLSVGSEGGRHERQHP